MQIPFLPRPGIASDDSSFSSEGRWIDGNGFRFRGGAPETVGGALEMAGATTVMSVNKMLVMDDAGTVKLAVAGDTLRLSAPDTAGTDITPASGWATTVGTRRCLQMYGDVLLASVSGGKLFESAAGAQATEVVNAPDQITCMIVTPSRQVMALGCNEEASGTFNGRCIRWCDIENYDDWTTSPSNNAGEYILPGQAEIVSGCVLGDYILIWTEGGFWLGTFTGDPGATFNFTRIDDVGIAGLDAWAAYRQALYWMGPDRGFYAYQPGGTVQRVHCPLSVEFSESTLAVTFGCTVSRHGEIWFGMAASASTQPSVYLVYCVDESSAAQAPVWFKGTFALAGFQLAGAMVDSPLLSADLATYGTTAIVHGFSTGPTSGKPWRWDCPTNNTSGAGATLGISNAYLQSGDVYLDNAERRVMVRGIAPDFKEQTGAVYLTAYVRERALAEATTKGPYTLATSTALAGCRVNGAVSSGSSQVAVNTFPEAMATGVVFTIAGVNAWENGADTGELKRLTVASDFIGGNGTITFTPAVVNSGPSRNVVNLPANFALVNALTRKSKKDLRLSGKIFALRFTSAGPFRIRFGKPIFDAVPLGER